MSAILILPGLGGRYTTETLTASATTANDTFTFLVDCDGFVVQVEHVSGTPTGDVQLERDAGSGGYDDFGSAISIATNHDITMFDESDGPFQGVWRIDATNITDGTVKIHVTAKG